MNNEWKPLYEEEVFDNWGNNEAGVLANEDGDVLFYHIFPDGENGPCYVHIYNSIWMMDESEECCFLANNDNWDTLYKVLNNSDGYDLVGDDGILHQIEFKK